MPLDRHLDGGVHLAPDETAMIRFAMASDGRVVIINLPISVMRSEFGESRLEPLAHFESHRAVIEATASQIYDAADQHDDRLQLTAVNFTTTASRALSSEQSQDR